MRIPLLLALSQLTLLMVFHGEYNYFRDELYYIACSDHLDWGFVDQPPLSIFILKVSRWILGDSLHAIRFLPALASAIVVVLAAWMAKKLGGGKISQAFASLCVVAAPGLLGHGRYFSMNAFDVLFWTLTLCIFLAMLASDKPILRLLFGLVIGLGLQNKYSIGFLCIGIVAGLVLTNQRRQLTSKWFWVGAGLSAIIFLPHVTWEIVHDFPSIEFMRNASQDKNVPLSILDFFLGQVQDLNFANAPIWLSGLYFFLLHPSGKQFRPLGWTYLVVFIVMVAGNAKVYYLSPIYPVMFSGGAVFLERLILAHNWNWLKPVYAAIIIIIAMISLPFAVPVLPVEKLIQYQQLLGMKPRQEERSAVAELPQYYADQFGWEEMVETVANVYHSLTPEEQAQCVIYVRNYGEAGAIDFYGKKFKLPKATCPHNSYWLWGPGNKTGNIAIIFGDHYNLDEDLADLKGFYKEVAHAATTNCTYCMPFENGRFIFICKGMNTTFQEIWSTERFYF